MFTLYTWLKYPLRVWDSKKVSTFLFSRTFGCGLDEYKKNVLLKNYVYAIYLAQVSPPCLGLKKKCLFVFAYLWVRCYQAYEYHGTVSEGAQQYGEK